jgi:hypothetical protein
MRSLAAYALVITGPAAPIVLGPGCESGDIKSTQTMHSEGGFAAAGTEEYPIGDDVLVYDGA